MATNLRLQPEAEEAVRLCAAQTGRSQQNIIRAAVDQYLGLSVAATPRSAAEAMGAASGALPARAAYRELDQLIPLPADMSTKELLDRQERF